MTLSRIIEVKKDELNDDVISTSKHCDGYHIGFREKVINNTKSMEMLL